jgi:DNA-binding transcriptional LysR family regulator
MIYANYEYFLAIVRNKNITKAANELYISQPALSNYLKRLENKLGIKLFDIKSQPLKLTYAGERYLHYVNRYVSLLNKMESEFSEIESFERGKITIGISPWRASYILPIILPAFKEKYPHIEVVTMEGVENELCELVSSNKVDFSLKSFAYPNLAYNYENIIIERILLAINIKNPVIKKLGLSGEFDKNNIKHIDIMDIKDENFILPKQSQELYNVIQRMLTFHKIDINGFETGNIATALNLVSQNYGLTFVPESRIIHSKSIKDIIFFTIGSPILYWYFTIIYRNDLYLSKISKLFINELKENYKGQCI